MERGVPACWDGDKLAFTCKNVIPPGRGKFNVTSSVSTTRHLILSTLAPPGRDISATSLYMQNVVPARRDGKLCKPGSPSKCKQKGKIQQSQETRHAEISGLPKKTRSM